MNCNICGARSVELHRVYSTKLLQNRIARKCMNGHAFFTVEVYPNQLSDAREMACAVRSTNRRIELYKRDLLISLDKRSNKEVAASYGLTVARVRQIRSTLNRE
jgi:hypothetical protein